MKELLTKCIQTLIEDDAQSANVIDFSKASQTVSHDGTLFTAQYDAGETNQHLGYGSNKSVDYVNERLKNNYQEESQEEGEGEEFLPPEDTLGILNDWVKHLATQTRVVSGVARDLYKQLDDETKCWLLGNGYDENEGSQSENDLMLIWHMQQLPTNLKDRANSIKVSLEPAMFQLNS